MTRAAILCEGQTEAKFVNAVLAPELATRGVYLYAPLIGTPGHKGGAVAFSRMLTDIGKLLKNDPNLRCSTFFDYYGLRNDFPGKTESLNQATIEGKARAVESALAEELRKKLGADLTQRFIPYVQLFEFEGLLFSEPQALADAMGQPQLGAALTAIRQQFESPEAINDSPRTAPSKRILSLFSPYNKPQHGTLAAQRMTLAAIRRECRLFNAWLNRLESLGQ